MKLTKKFKLFIISVISFISLIALIISLFFLFNPIFNDSQLTLRVGAYENEPKIYTNKDGIVVGFFPELLEHIALKEGWEIEYINGTWVQCLERLENNEIDIMVDVAYTEARAEKYDFTNIDVLTNWGIVYKKVGSTIETLSDLEGMIVAVMTGSVHTDGEMGIKNITKQIGINCTFIELDDYYQVFEMISSGEADVGIVNRLFGIFNEEQYNVKVTSIIFNPMGLRFAFPKNASMNQYLITRLDKQLLELIEDTNSMYYELLESYIYGFNELRIPEWIIITVITSIGLVALFFSTSAILNHKVRSRTTELQKAEEKSRYLIDGISSAGIGIDIVTKDYKVLFQNQVLREKFGNITGKLCYEYYMGFKAPCDFCPMIKSLKNNTIESTELKGIDGNNYELYSAPYQDSEGNIDKVIEIVMNITEHKQAKMALRESEVKYKEVYNRAEFYKDVFAHDINNILQSILSGVQVSERILEYPEKRENLKINARIIKKQVIRGAKLVSNVRKLSQLEEPNQNLEKIEILKVLKKVISIVKKSYEKDNNLDIRIDSVDENIFVKANNFLEDVFDNLLINAIQYNNNSIKKNTVCISREQQNNINYLKMEFQDNGVGIADFMKVQIFRRVQNKDVIFLGMGLGLSLVRGIIETYNGKIWVEDRVKGDRSKGSNFVLLIPEVD